MGNKISSHNYRNPRQLSNDSMLTLNDPLMGGSTFQSFNESINEIPVSSQHNIQEPENDAIMPRNSSERVVERYEGEYKDGKRHGKGTQVYWNGRKYIGDWLEDKMAGSGVFLWADGKKYEGSYVANKKQGYGILTWSDGKRYEGYWFEGLYHGKGKFFFSNGKIFDGMWRNGFRVQDKKDPKSDTTLTVPQPPFEMEQILNQAINRQPLCGCCQSFSPEALQNPQSTNNEGRTGRVTNDLSNNKSLLLEKKDIKTEESKKSEPKQVLVGKESGFGIERWSDGTEYLGEWRNYKKHGKGTYKLKNGETYEGHWEDDKKHGHGVYSYQDGKKYDGEWKNDLQEGYGVETGKYGSKYEGEWKEGKRFGKGTQNWTEKSTYTGDWQDDKMAGSGVLISLGTKYEGSFIANKKHGFGIMTWPDGKRYEGYWSEDMQYGKGKEYLPDGTVKSGKWEYGTCQKYFDE